ncbi:hypothetical protein BDZ97DRAFT_1807457 [Flammula alnicola]|nr:hypothetical protein BDZ97DRAFT_1807457 [Flammula alnicola]
MRLFPPHSVLAFLVSLVLLSLCFEVFAIKLVDVTPSVERYRRNLAVEYKRKRELTKPRPISPLPPKIQNGSRASDSKTTSAFSPNTHRKRQDLNLSCNNVTVTPPGFDGSCGPGRPCPNGACCPDSTFCGVGCLSNCDALAECGPDAAPGNENCPLNVCCSQFGFCGTTDEFCGTGCTGPHCSQPQIPSGVNSDVTSRVIGYYEVFFDTHQHWYWTHSGLYRFPQNIPSSGYTHLNYAFASIDPNTFQVVPASAADVPQYTQFTGLKQANPNLKTYISVGGWAFNDPPTQHVFSNTASSAANQQAFANSLVNFMIQYGFDGVDIDWEYPVACERGGVDADMQNMVLLFETMRKTFDSSGHTFGLTFTAPSSFWYLQHFDLLGLLSYADWVNLMSYDLHGVWDAKDVYIGSIVQAHTNLTEIEQSVQLFQRVGVPLEKVVLGLGFYGRTFELSDPSCTEPGCHFSGPAPGGPCTASDGILSFAEIEQTISQSNSTPVYDTTAQVKYLVYDENNWVSYDDAVTFQAKVDWAKGAGLGGLMVWAVDLDDFKMKFVLIVNDQANSAVLGVSIQDNEIPSAHDLNSNDGQNCMQAACGENCPSGYVQMTANPTSGCGGKSIGQPVCFCQRNSCLGLHITLSMTCYLTAGEISLASDSWGTGHKCSSGHKEFCCESGLSDSQIDEATDCQWYFGDTSIAHACWMQEKSLCCAPPTGASTTSPFDPADLFPNPPSDGDLSWDLQDDPIDSDAPDGGDAANDNSFGLLALDGPSNLLSDVGISSDWVVLGCKDNSDNLQKVTAFCSKPEDDPTSGCSAVFESGAKNTIVKMPPGCGGSFARLAHLEINTDLTVPGEYASRKPNANPVYEMHFDYSFHLLSETRSAADGTVLLRADATTFPGYWAEIDTADPGSSVRRDLEKRWFGAFDDWLKRLTKVQSDTSADLVMQESFSSVLFSASQHCESDDGTLTFDASISITAQGLARAHLNYGFYLEGSLFPFNVDAAYVYANSDASASLGFEVSGRAALQYDTGRVPLIPELAWPGVGPTFNIYGQIIGQLSLSGTFGASAVYTFPQGHVSLGLVGGVQTPVDQGSSTVGTQDYGWTVQPTVDVELGGSLSVHVIPEGAVVFTIFPGTPASIGAQATVTVDGAITMSFTSNTQGVEAHIGAQVDFLAGATGLGSTVGPYNFYHQEFTLYDQSLSFSESTRRSLPAAHDSASDGLALGPSFGITQFHEAENKSRFSAREGSLEPRGLFSGLFNCPQPTEDTGTSGSCGDALADSVPDPDPDDGDNELEARSEIHTVQLERRVSVKGCSTLKINPPPYTNTIEDGIWDLIELDDLSTTVADWGERLSYAAKTTNRNDDGYAREHVYEDVVIPNVDLRGMTACNWLNTYVFSPFGTQGVMLSSALAAVQPTGTDEMPVLMGIANSAKEAFIAGQKEFRTLANMQGASKDASAILFLLRAAGVATDYMQDKTIELEFKIRANAVRQLWITFMAEYEAVFPPAQHFDISTAYRCNGLLTGFNTRAATFLANAQTALIGKIPGGQNTVTVHLPITCQSYKDMDIDAAQINALSYTQLSWTYF